MSSKKEEDYPDVIRLVRDLAKDIGGGWINKRGIHPLTPIFKNSSICGFNMVFGCYNFPNVLHLELN